MINKMTDIPTLEINSILLYFNVGILPIYNLLRISL